MQAVDEVRRLFVLRSGLGRHDPSRRGRVLRSFGWGPSTATTDGSAATASLTAARSSNLLGTVDRRDQVDRTGGALPEALGDEVVGLLGRGVVGEVALGPRTRAGG